MWRGRDKRRAVGDLIWKAERRARLQARQRVRQQLTRILRNSRRREWICTKRERIEREVAAVRKIQLFGRRRLVKASRPAPLEHSISGTGAPGSGSLLDAHNFRGMASVRPWLVRGYA